MLPEVRSKLQVSPKLASAQQTQMPIYYKVNGTGRDTYIHCNNGGFSVH